MIQQVVDGLLQMPEFLPEHVLMELHTSLQTFATSLELKEAILPVAFLSNIAPIVRSTLASTEGLGRPLRRLLTLLTQQRSS